MKINKDSRIVEFNEFQVKGKCRFQLRDGIIDIYNLSMRDIQIQYLRVLKVAYNHYSIIVTVGGKTKILRYN